MGTSWIKILRDAGNTIYDVFLLPGDFFLSKIATYAPVTAEKLGIGGDENSVALLIILSSSLWFLSAVVVWRILRLWQNAVSIVSAMCGTISFRISLTIRNLKTLLICNFRQYFPRRVSNGTDLTPEVQFDDLDLAVLRSAVALGPGFAVSAPELAEQFTMRPAQIQRSLDKLSKNKMLDYVIGSTDGFDNYRLTVSGAAFMAMWQQDGRNS